MAASRYCSKTAIEADQEVIHRYLAGSKTSGPIGEPVTACVM